MFDHRSSKLITLIALPVIVLIFYFTASSHFDYTPDDTYIYLQYAKNLLHGDGVSFNAGEPSYGITSPLWLFLISIGGLVGVDVYVAAKTIDLFFASIAIVIFYFLAFEVIRDIMVAVVATLAFSSHSWLLRWAGTGMETSISVLLILVSVLFCLRNEYLLSVIFAALLTLVRPESCFLVLFIAIDLYVNSKDRRQGLKVILKIICIYLIMLSPWLIYAYNSFHTIIPNSGLAKSFSGFHLQEILQNVLNVFKIVGASDGIGIVVLLICGLILLIQYRKNGSGDVKNEDAFYVWRQSIVALSLIVAIPSVYLVLRIPVVSRYLLLISPLILILAFTYLFRVLQLSKYRQYTYAGVIFFTAFFMVQNQILYQQVVKPGIEAFEFGMQTSLIQIGKWLKQNSDSDDVILCWDIGAVGYYSNRRICDGTGLVSPSLLKLKDEQLPDDQWIDRYTTLCNAKYVLHRSLQSEELSRNPKLFPIMTKPFYRLGLLKEELYYYTLYKMVSDQSEINPPGL